MTDTTHDLRSAMEPCQWCGPKVAVNVKSSGQFRHWVQCYGGCRGPVSSSEGEAIAAWNRRALASDTIGNGGGEAAPVAWMWDYRVRFRDDGNDWSTGQTGRGEPPRDNPDYRNIRPLYAHPPAAEPVGLREANCFGIPNVYRGWLIKQGADDRFYVAAPDDAASWDDLCEGIDAWEEEHGRKRDTRIDGSSGASYVRLLGDRRDAIGLDAFLAECAHFPDDYCMMYRGDAKLTAGMLRQALATPARTDDAGLGGPLLRPASTSAPKVCYCKGTCGAPIIMGRRAPCLRGLVPGAAIPAALSPEPDRGADDAAQAGGDVADEFAKPRIVEVNRIATLLMDTWKRVDPNSGVAEHMTSYVATFADMARMVVDDRELTASPVVDRGSGDVADGVRDAVRTNIETAQRSRSSGITQEVEPAVDPIIAAHEAMSSGLGNTAGVKDCLTSGGDCVSITREMFDFLCGAGPLEGYHFSDKHEVERGTWWWRKRLHAMAKAAYPTGAGEGDDEVVTVIKSTMAGIQEANREARAMLAGKPPADVVSLVVAGREAWEFLQEHQPNDEVTAALDKALERFASRVCYNDEGGDLPETHADPCTCGSSLSDDGRGG